MGRLIRVLSAAFVGVAATAAWPTASLAQPSAERTSAPVLQTVRLERMAGAITGIVSDERGRPLSGAMVSVNGATLEITVSDERGWFSLDKLPDGEYMLRAQMKGFIASPRQVVYVGPSKSAGHHRLQLRRLDGSVGTAGTPTEPIRSRPIVAAGFELPKAETEPAATADGTAVDHPHTDVAWRLRHIKRSILKDSATTVVLAGNNPDFETGSVFGRAMHSATALAGALFSDIPFTGEVNLLTTGAFGPDLWSGTALPRGIAYFSLGAPTPAGDWMMRAGMSEGDLSSWNIAGSFVSRRDPVHTYNVGLTYSTQEYLGGNPAALVAVKDGSRNVGEVYGFDRWVLSPGFAIEYGARYARHDYLEERGLLSPKLGLTLEPVKGTRITTVLAQRKVAPGAEEFLSPGTGGPWLPPERTFAPLRDGDPLRVENARYLDVMVEHEFEDSYVIGVRRFFQEVDNQLVTLFGLSLSDEPRSVGHYYVASAGSVDAQGWGLRLGTPPDRRVRASVDYSVTRTRWIDRAETSTITRWAPGAIRPDSEDIHDVTASFETDITETATRVSVLYKFNTAFTRTTPHTPAGMEGRFDLQVNQALPIAVAGTRWEVLLGVRNLFRDPRDPASVYDELLVVRPPKRVIGGFLVRF
jgi:hypothetical protein